MIIRPEDLLHLEGGWAFGTEGVTRCGLLACRYVQGLDFKICTSPPPEDTPSLSCSSPSPYLLDVGLRNKYLLSSPPSCSKDKSFLLGKVDAASKYKHLGRASGGGARPAVLNSSPGWISLTWKKFWVRSCVASGRHSPPPPPKET